MSTLVHIARLDERFNMRSPTSQDCRAIQHEFSKPSLVNLISKNEPGKLDIKRRVPGILTHCFTLKDRDIANTT